MSERSGTPWPLVAWLAGFDSRRVFACLLRAAMAGLPLVLFVVPRREKKSSGRHGGRGVFQRVEVVSHLRELCLDRHRLHDGLTERLRLRTS